ncbi:coiled-coil domain-containing protein 103-like [Branchiostoma floridae]|uniref:Coiled-coil domain-containing protein 103-like n=1 Tax=Branchiostoma floridae TaxID=7739 RepID=A0A9J7HK39_BRAFL|nr:coiled-coil domain-containing protein 103-like [Branchiostoma floridae]
MANMAAQGESEDDVLDFRKLERELAAAVEADHKYQRENDAKFRAIKQQVGSYDEFRDIVMASHLRPLEKKDNLQNMDIKQPWNVHASSQADGQNAAQTQIQQDEEKLPKNGHEFARDWKRYCKTTPDKYKFIKKIGGEKLADIFKNEISFGLLGEILTALNDSYVQEDSDFVYQVLDGLTKVGRFELSVDFLSSKESQAAKELLGKLTKDFTDDSGIEQVTSRLDALRKLYKVS